MVLGGGRCLMNEATLYGLTPTWRQFVQGYHHMLPCEKAVSLDRNVQRLRGGFV